MRELPKKLSFEEIEAIVLPKAVPTYPGAEFYFPFDGSEYDTGKVASYALCSEYGGTIFPKWTEEATRQWMFNGCKTPKRGHLVFESNRGTLHIKVKDGLDYEQCVKNVANIIRSAATSHEQKEATANLLFYRTFEVVSDTITNER